MTKKNEIVRKKIDWNAISNGAEKIPYFEHKNGVWEKRGRIFSNERCNKNTYMTQLKIIFMGLVYRLFCLILIYACYEFVSIR